MFNGRLAAQAARSASLRASMASRPAVRTYAQAAPPSPQSSTKPPVALFGVDGTYASALFTAAAKTSALEPVSKAMESLQSTFKKNPKLQQLIVAPTLSATDKQQIVSELLKTVGPQDKGDVVKNFLKTLAENNRLGVLEPVTEHFAKLMGAHRGEVELTITAAAPLEPRVLKQVEVAVSKSQYVGQGKRLKVVPKVDPAIKGGLIVEIGDRTIDLSVLSKMVRMNKLLRDQL